MKNFQQLKQGMEVGIGGMLDNKPKKINIYIKKIFII